MIHRLLTLVTAATLVTAILPAVAQDKDARATQKAHQRRMKECGAEWQRAKADGKTGGKTFDQFSAECLRKKNL